MKKNPPARRYNKLVRDRIPEIIRSRGMIPMTHVAGDTEYRTMLQEKLREEVEELIAAESDAHAVEELADVQEVLLAFYLMLGTDGATVEATRRTKAEARGAFSKRIILEETRESPGASGSSLAGAP